MTSKPQLKLITYFKPSWSTTWMKKYLTGRTILGLSPGPQTMVLETSTSELSTTFADDASHKITNNGCRKDGDTSILEAAWQVPIFSFKYALLNPWTRRKCMPSMLISTPAIRRHPYRWVGYDKPFPIAYIPERRCDPCACCTHVNIRFLHLLFSPFLNALWISYLCLFYEMYQMYTVIVYIFSCFVFIYECFAPQSEYYLNISYN